MDAGKRVDGVIHLDQLALYVGTTLEQQEWLESSHHEK
jgi:hypothetical protein